MGLNTIIGNAVNTAFAVLGTESADGLQIVANYYRTTVLGSYSPATGTTSKTEVLYPLDAVFYAARNREEDGSKIMIDDKRIIFPSSIISFSPTQDDRVVIGSDEYNIVNFYQDPAKATWIIWLRGT